MYMLALLAINSSLSGLIFHTSCDLLDKRWHIVHLWLNYLFNQCGYNFCNEFNHAILSLKLIIHMLEKQNKSAVLCSIKQDRY